MADSKARLPINFIRVHRSFWQPSCQLIIVVLHLLEDILHLRRQPQKVSDVRDLGKGLPGGNNDFLGEPIYVLQIWCFYSNCDGTTQISHQHYYSDVSYQLCKIILAYCLRIFHGSPPHSIHTPTLARKRFTRRSCKLIQAVLAGQQGMEKWWKHMQSTWKKKSTTTTLN